MQANAVIGMASDLFTPAMGLIANCFDFVKRKRGLGVKFALFIDPGAVRHIYLDPISAMVELFAGSFARFYRAIDELCAFRHIDFRSVAFKRITASGGDRA